MKSLYLRIWLTVVATLALFALSSGWLMQRHLAQERAQAEAMLAERMASWGELMEDSMPTADSPRVDQAEAVVDWSRRLRLPLALDDISGRRIAASESYLRQERDGLAASRAVSVRFEDGRRLWMLRPSLARLRKPDPVLGLDFALWPDRRMGPPPDRSARSWLDPRRDAPPEERADAMPPRDLERLPGELLPNVPGLSPKDGPGGWILVGLLGLLFLSIAVASYPVVRGLTRRLEQLRKGVDAFGAGALDHRVAVVGRDEVAAVAASFNSAAERIETLVQANQSLLANASHELRSPLARLKIAVQMLDDAPAAMRTRLATEIHTNIAELDALVEEVLLSSRLEAGAPVELNDQVDLLGLAAEEAARVGTVAVGDALVVRGSDRLLRRALRNLFENARRYGGEEVAVQVGQDAQALWVQVCDRGPGVPDDLRERIFEPFYRLPGHAEHAGGVGLGLALVRQIAQRHEGEVVCTAREGGGTCFTLRLPPGRRLNAA